MVSFVYRMKTEWITLKEECRAWGKTSNCGDDGLTVQRTKNYVNSK